MTDCNNCQRTLCTGCPQRKEAEERIDALVRKTLYFKVKQQPQKTSQKSLSFFFLIAATIIILI
ncbi:MAG: hypothetical protein WC349_03585 [Patescibacteria group bacterium]|jgi:hypothetical protein